MDVNNAYESSRRGSAQPRVWAFLTVALALALSFLALTPHAMATETEDSTESLSTLAAEGFPMTGSDYVWAGENLNLTDRTFENDVLTAGRNIAFSDITVPGDIRAAAQTIQIASASVTQNVSVAAETIDLGDVSANGITAACRAFTFSGSCKELTVYASDVFIDGTVEGDIVVSAGNVEIGKNAHIKGTLHVDAPQEPVMQRGAEVGNVEYTHTEKDESAEDAAMATAGVLSGLAIFFAIVGFFGTLIMAVLAEWLFARYTKAAANIIRTRTGATIGTGIVGTLVSPVALIILCVLVVTIPVAIALLFALITMGAVAGGFAGASLFKLAFPKLGQFKCALAGGAIVGIASAIPVLGSIVKIVAFAYLLGYVLQTIYLDIHKNAEAGDTAGN